MILRRNVQKFRAYFPHVKSFLLNIHKSFIKFNENDIKLKKEVFSQDAFQSYAKDELVLVEIDFPRSKEQSDEVKAQNEALAKKYGIRGFPTILLLSPEGELIGRTGYQPGGTTKYVAHLKEILAGR